MRQSFNHLKQVVYIASCWHSGSTLLDLLLGSHSEITSTGELSKATEFFRGDFGASLCTCGEPLVECSFWKGVTTNLRERLENRDLSLGDFPVAVLPDRKTMHRLLPSFVELLMLIGSKTAWRLAACVNPNHISFRASRNVACLLEAIAQQANTPVVVDSSKQPGQLKGMYLTAPERVRILFLTRDGRANALSQRKADGVDLQTAAKKWVRFNRNLIAVLATIPKAGIFSVRYEDLCMKTQETMESIYHFLNLPAPSDLVSVRIEKSKYHIIGGNPMRYRKNESQIVLDEKWKRDLTNEEIEQLQSIVGPLNRRFGYNA